MIRSTRPVCRSARPGPVLAVLAAAGLSASPGPAAAHPHAWIDQRTTAVFGETGAVERLRVSWRFDPVYTAFIVQDTDTDGDGRADAAALAAMAEQTLVRLADFGYFAKAWVDGEEAVWAGAGEPEAVIEGDRLRMGFTLDLGRAVDPRAHAFSYAVFDPTYWIEIRHPDGSAATLEGAPPAASCATRLVVPDPDAEAVALAAALDSLQSGGDDLGLHFADRIEVRCDGS